MSRQSNLESSAVFYTTWSIRFCYVRFWQADIQKLSKKWRFLSIQLSIHTTMRPYYIHNIHHKVNRHAFLRTNSNYLIILWFTSLRSQTKAASAFFYLSSELGVTRNAQLLYFVHWRCQGRFEELAGYLCAVSEHVSETHFPRAVNYKPYESFESSLISWALQLMKHPPGVDQRKHQSSTSLAFVWGIHWVTGEFPHKGPVT